MADDIELSEAIVEPLPDSVQESSLTEISTGEPLPELPPEPPPPPELPGKKLREARERQGLAVTDVAQTLKFSARQVEAMERDDWHAISGGHAVARGFLRSYARFLQLDAEPLLTQLTPPSEPSDADRPRDINEPMPESKRWRLSPFTALSLFFLLAALALATWHFLDISQPNPVAPILVQETAPVIEVESTPETLPIRELVFKTTDKAWIEVKDAHEQTLLSGDCPAGERRVVKSALPIHLVIGNASSVTLTLDGQPFDLNPHSKADVARFSIE